MDDRESKVANVLIVILFAAAILLIIWTSDTGTKAEPAADGTETQTEQSAKSGDDAIKDAVLKLYNESVFYNSTDYMAQP